MEVSIHSICRAAGLINAAFPRRLAQAEASPQTITDQLLTDGAASTAEGQLWTRLAAELEFILISTTKAAAAAAATTTAATVTVCRQMGINANGFETWRQIHRRFSIPVGARNICKVKDITAPRRTKEKERRISHRSRESISTGNPDKRASKGKEKYHPNTMKGTRKSKGKDTCCKCGTHATNVATRPHRRELPSCSVQC